MKIPTSTSFVMAATASLALQSSALVMPQHPDSPDVGHASPRASGRPGATTQFPGQSPNARPDSNGRSSSPNRGLRMREAVSTDSINALLDDTSGLVTGSLSGLGIVTRASDKGVDKSSEGSGSVSIHARQAPVPISPGIPGAAGSVTSAPGQAANGAIQQGSGIPSIGAGTGNGAEPQGIPQPPQEAPLSFTSLAAALPTGGVTPSAENAPVPAPVAGLVQRDADDPSGSLGEIGQVSGAAGQTAGGVIDTAGGASGQIVGGTPAGSVVGNAPLNVPGVVQGTVNGVTNAVPTVANAAGGVASGIAGTVPVSQITGIPGQVADGTPAGAVSRNVLQDDGQQLNKPSANAPTDGTRSSDYSDSGAGATPFGMLQGQADPDGGPIELTSPSSTVAAPSTSPFSSPVVADPTDSTGGPLAVSTNSAPAESTSVTSMERRQNLPVNPTSVVAGFIPSVPIVSSALPNSVPAPVSAPTGAPGAQAGIPQVIPSLPVNPPVNPPVNSAVSSPGNPLTDAPPALPRFIPMKRKLSERAGPASPDLPLPSGFAAPTAPIKGDAPPLLMPANAARSVKENVGVDVSASVDNPPSATSTVQPGTSVLPANAPTPVSADNRVSTTVQPGTSMLPTSQPTSTTTTVGAVAATASTPTRRRRFFRFGREENA